MLREGGDNNQCSLATLQNASVEVYYPPEWYRDDVGVLWYADVSTRDGTLRQLTMTPTRLRCLPCSF